MGRQKPIEVQTKPDEPNQPTIHRLLHREFLSPQLHHLLVHDIQVEAPSRFYKKHVDFIFDSAWNDNHSSASLFKESNSTSWNRESTSSSYSQSNHGSIQMELIIGTTLMLCSSTTNVITHHPPILLYIILILGLNQVKIQGSQNNFLC